MKMLFAVLAFVLAFAPLAQAGEDEKQPTPPRRGDRGGGENNQRGNDRRGDWGGRNRTNQPGQQNPNDGRGFNPGGPGGGPAGMFGGRSGMLQMASRMLGFDIDDPKSPPKLDVLPLGSDKRYVMNVPVGGVDNFSGSGAGWKMEGIFKMTEEQVKAADKLREEYAEEQKKLSAEMNEQMKVMAERVKTLRDKYEERANDILTGADKESKQKMDTLTKETNTKRSGIIAEMLPMYDINDPAQGMQLLRVLREKWSAMVQTADDKLLELTPVESKPKVQEVLKNQQETRQRFDRMMRGPGGGGPPGAGGDGGARRGGGGDAVKPPQPPEKNGNF